MIKVSVIIPTYKPKDYLLECLKCFNHQTEKEFIEIIVILNGPKNPYYSKIESFIAKTPSLNIVLEYIEENGVSLARNRGLDIAKGEYISFVDDDDMVSHDYISSLLGLIKPASIVCSNVKAFVNNLDHLKSDYLTEAFVRNKNRDGSQLFWFRSFLSSACCKLIPKEVIKLHRFNTGFGVGEDALFMASISKNINEVIFTQKETLYYRRIREESASRKKRSTLFELRNTLKLMSAYAILYLSSPFKYNLLFFLTREAAVLKTMIFRLKKDI